MNKRRSESRPTAAILARLLGLAFQAHKKYFAVTALKSIFFTVQTVFQASMVSVFLYLLETGRPGMAVMGVAAMIALELFLAGINKWCAKAGKIHQEILKEELNQRMFLKMTRVPYHHLENPEYLDMTERARGAVVDEGCIGWILTETGKIVQNIMTILSLAAVLLFFDGRLILILASAAACNAALLRAFSKTRLEFSDENRDINRKFSYYMNTLLDYRNGKDFRMYAVGNLMLKKYAHFAKRLVSCYKGFLRKSGKNKTLMMVVKYTEMTLVYGMIAAKTISGGLMVSEFALYTSAALSFSAAVSAVIEASMSFYIGLRMAVPFVELMETPEDNSEGEGVACEERLAALEFQDVTFSYPGESRPVLKHISFRINAGEKISIVGLNGAGKTTLIKLICRLYRPDSGEILLNGISIYDYEYRSYIKKISTIFQDFKLFAYSIKDNITVDGTEEQAFQAACRVGLKEKLDSLSDGIRTPYMKSFGEGGVELSGGEAQKAALARALEKRAELVILDEPTSALDPLAEAEFYQNFNELVKNQTVIYISHRMSSSIFCDRILLIENGAVADYDTHASLIRKKGSMYYKLFMEQANAYEMS